MSSPDQENLLPLGERNNNEGQTISFRNNTNYHGTKSQVRKNLLLLTISFLIATCLTIYIYLNYITINEVGGGSNGSDQSEQSNRYKPLSRRKPILDHESIFSESGPSMLKLSDLMAHCIVALQIGGDKVVQLSLNKNEKLANVGSKGKTKEGADDVVTNADIQSHKAVLNTIKDTYRRLKIVSEEDTTSDFENLKMETDILPIDRNEFAHILRKNILEIEGNHSVSTDWPLVVQDETLVWIDPLDATKEYSENLTEYVTLMACIVHRNVPIAGIIHEPFLNMTFWSLKDESNRRTVYSSDLLGIWSQHQMEKKKKELKEEIEITVSRSHAGDVEKMLRFIYGQKVRIVPAGGSGYKTIELIKGNVDAYIHVTNIKKWDICAPYAILDSLPGGNMTNLKGGDIKFGSSKEKVATNGLIASFGSDLHKDLVRSLDNYLS